MLVDWDAQPNKNLGFRCYEGIFALKNSEGAQLIFRRGDAEVLGFWGSKKKTVADIEKDLIEFFSLREGYGFKFKNRNGNAFHADNKSISPPTLKNINRVGISTVAHLNERIEARMKGIDVKTWDRRRNMEVPGQTAFRTVSSQND